MHIYNISFSPWYTTLPETAGILQPSFCHFIWNAPKAKRTRRGYNTQHIYVSLFLPPSSAQYTLPEQERLPRVFPAVHPFQPPWNASKADRASPPPEETWMTPLTNLVRPDVIYNRRECIRVEGEEAEVEVCEASTASSFTVSRGH